MSPSRSQNSFRAGSIRSAVNGSTAVRTSAAAVSVPRSSSAGSASTSWKRKPAKPANSPKVTIFPA